MNGNHFFIAFFDPGRDAISNDSAFLSEVSDFLSIPSEEESNLQLPQPVRVNGKHRGCDQSDSSRQAIQPIQPIDCVHHTHHPKQGDGPHGRPPQYRKYIRDDDQVVVEWIGKALDEDRTGDGDKGRSYLGGELWPWRQLAAVVPGPKDKDKV